MDRATLGLWNVPIFVQSNKPIKSVCGKSVSAAQNQIKSQRNKKCAILLSMDMEIYILLLGNTFLGARSRPVLLNVQSRPVWLLWALSRAPFRRHIFRRLVMRSSVPKEKVMRRLIVVFGD